MIISRLFMWVHVFVYITIITFLECSHLMEGESKSPGANDKLNHHGAVDRETKHK